MAATHEDRNAQLSPGVAIKAPCRAATTAAITLSGEQTIDGVACVDGDRVLVKNQTSSIDNGIYGCSTGTWEREPDFDGNRDVVTGTFVFITSGATNAGAFYECTTTGTVVFGTSNITFAVGALGPIALPLNLSNTTFTQAGAGATARTGLDKTRDIISVKDFNALGDGVTDDTAAIQAAINAAFLLGATLYFPAGVYLCASTVIFKNKITYIGAGKDSATTKGTLIKCTGASDGVQINNPINSSTAANITIQDLWIQCTTRTAGKAALADVGSTYLNLHRVGVSGNDYGIILDQSELVNITECDCELSSGSSTAGLWLVNGADHTGGGSAQFTNRITVKNSQFNGTVGIGIADDGGSCHHYSDNNFNALAKHIRIANVNGVVIDGENEFENPTTTSIHFAATKLSGAAVSATSNAVLGANVFSSPDAINFITYDVGGLLYQFIVGNLFINNNAGGSPSTGIVNVSQSYGFGNYQSGTGSAAATALGNYLQNLPLRTGGSVTLAASEVGLLNFETPVHRFYIGDGTGYSFAFSKRTGSVTTDLGTMTDAGIFSLKGKFYPATDAGAVQTASGRYAGTGVPNNANGNNGDYYDRSDGTAAPTAVKDHTYFKAGGVWGGIA